MTPEQLAAKGSEDGHQAALFCMANRNLNNYPELRWMFAIPNGGNRDARQGARLKMTGVKAGVWDIFLPVPVVINQSIEPISSVEPWDSKKIRYHGLFIEMKKPKVAKQQSAGTLQPNQKEFAKHAEFFDYGAVVCYTWEEAWQAIVMYLAHLPEYEREHYRDTVK